MLKPEDFFDLRELPIRNCFKTSGSFRWSMKSSQRQVWRCKDGFVFFNIIGGRTGAKTLQELVKWMNEEGKHDPYLQAMDWETLDMFKVDQAEVDRISKPIEEYGELPALNG
jgi:hypothetical protein